MSEEIEALDNARVGEVVGAARAPDRTCSVNRGNRTAPNYCLKVGGIRSAVLVDGTIEFADVQHGRRLDLFRVE